MAPRRVFLLTSDAGPSGAARLVAALAEGLPRDRFVVSVCDLPTERRIDPRRWLELRRTLTAFDPDVLHAVGPAAVRLAGLLKRTGGRRPAMVATSADRAEAGLARWLIWFPLRSADRVTARTSAEADRYRALGVRDDQLTVIPPGVSPPSGALDPCRFRRDLDIPDDGRLVIAAGRFDAEAGLRSAVWAFDVAKYAHPDLYLVLVGDGQDRRRVERFARGLGYDDYRVRFAGSRDDLPAVFALAEVVWVTHERGGVQTALEALAAGVPVVAVNTPDLAATVEDGVSARLVPPADRVRLAAVTHELLGSPAEARRLADAGRTRAAEFPPGRLLERFAALYDDLTRG